MNCVEAELFVSMLYDGEAVPDDARGHIRSCSVCQGCLRDYAELTQRMRVLAAAESQSLDAITRPPGLPRRSNWWRVLGASIRIPRYAVVIFTVILAIACLGWFRTTAQNKVITKFHMEMTSSRVLPDGSISGETSTGWLEVGKPFVSGSYEGYPWGSYETLGEMMEVLSIRKDAVVLRVRFKRFDHYLDSDQLRREMKKVTSQEITYVPEQQISVPVEGGTSILLKGSVGQEEHGSTISVKASSLLPTLDEIGVTAPILLRDGQQVLANQPTAGVQIDCAQHKDDTCGVSFYAPKSGLFFFSTRRTEGATKGAAAMSQVLFKEEGHSYTLCSQTPITGGDQPRDIWVLYLKNYLPSRHGGYKEDDALVSLGSGALSALLRPDPRGTSLPKH